MKNKLSKKDKIPFTQVPNAVLNDDRFKMKTIGIYCFMLSKPDDWKFTIKSMSSQINEGCDSIRVALNELKKYGLLEYYKNVDGTGEYIISTTINKPKSEIPNEPKLENPNLENPNMGKSNRINNKESITNKEYTNKESGKINFPDDQLKIDAAKESLNAISEFVDPNSTLGKLFVKDKKEKKKKELALKKEKSLKDKKLVDVSPDEVPSEEKNYYDIAVAFQQLFIKNLEENGSITTNQKKATYGNYVRDIRLMVEKDWVTNEHFRILFKFLQSSDFWKKNILSTSKLRQQTEKLLIEANQKPNGNTQQSANDHRQAELRRIYENTLEQMGEPIRPKKMF